MPSNGRVTVDLVLTLIAPETGLEVPARLHYRAADPYAVSLTFGLGPLDETVEWVFARELLVTGLSRPIGEGDVRVWPDRNGSDATISLQLSSPSGCATLAVPRSSTVDFLLSTYELVGLGRETEHLDVDRAVDSLLYNGLA